MFATVIEACGQSFAGRIESHFIYAKSFEPADRVRFENLCHWPARQDADFEGADHLVAVIGMDATRGGRIETGQQTVK